MALNVDVQVLTQPGATGAQTISLASNFDPKAIILYAVPAAADGTAASYAIGMGFGTYRGATVQQRYVTMRGLDAATSSDTARGTNNDALLVLQTQSAGASSRDLEIDLTSMQTGATSEVVINWTNLHTTASIRVFAIILGGSDITDALVGDFTVGITDTTDDVSIVSGFGKPELTFFGHVSRDAQLDEANDSAFGFGFCKQGEAGRGYFFTQNDADTNSVTSVSQRSDRCLLDSASAGTASFVGQLDTTVANWPTDGFRVVWDANPVEAGVVSYLALRTTAQITTGNGVAPVAGSPPVVQDLAAGFTPKLGLLFGWNDTALSGFQTTSTRQAGFGIGATDGTTEVWAGFTEDDAQGTMWSDRQQSTAKVIQNWNSFAAGGPTLNSEADGSFSGTNFRLSWNDIDTVAREYQWLVLGDAAGGVEHFGAASVDLTMNVAAAGKKDAKAATAVPLTAAIAVAGKKTAMAATAVPLTTTITVAGTKDAKGAAAVPLTATITVAGTRGARGAAAVPLTLTIAASGVKDAKGASAVPLAFNAATTATKTSYGASDVPLIFDFTTTGTIVGAEVIAYYRTLLGVGA